MSLPQDSYTMPLTSIQCWHVHCEECWLRTLVRMTHLLISRSIMNRHNAGHYANVGRMLKAYCSLNSPCCFLVLKCFLNIWANLILLSVNNQDVIRAAPCNTFYHVCRGGGGCSGGRGQTKNLVYK